MRKFLSTHLPEGLRVGTGFISDGSRHSNWLELIVFDAMEGTVYEEGNMVVVVPEAVRAFVGVFNEKNGLQDYLHILNQLSDLGKWVRVASGRDVLSGMWGRKADVSVMRKAMQGIQQACGGDASRALSLVMMGQELLGRWQADEGQGSWHIYGTRRLGNKMSDSQRDVIAQALVLDGILTHLSSEHNFSIRQAEQPLEVLSSVALQGSKAKVQAPVLAMAGAQAQSTSIGQYPVAVQHTEAKPINGKRKIGLIPQKSQAKGFPIPSRQSAKAISTKESRAHIQTDERGNTPLHLAVMAGDLNKVRGILKDPSLILEVKNQDGYAPLHLAAEKGQLELVRELIQAGADLNVRNYIYVSPLHLASLHGHTAVIDALIKAGAEIEARNNRSHTPLHTCAIHGSIEGASKLIQHGADLHARMEKDMHPLHLAAWYGQVEVAELLVNAGANRDAVNEDGNSPLHFAAFNGQVKVIKMMINHAADPSLSNKNGQTYLEGLNEGYQGDRLALLE